MEEDARIAKEATEKTQEEATQSRERAASAKEAAPKA